ncbi:hypothetical protein AB7783_07120 [Tardiphaga sp. 172_B4_N1_3]|uniref:hypothetical protein n=1 Tax=Tardiphaga sp. 172_B4_N1_3 TaxID=3240787 RepID=UPI003F8A03F8
MKQDVPATTVSPEEDEWTTFLANAIGGLRIASEELRKKRAKYEKKTDWFRSKKTGIPRENSVTRALADQFKEIRAKQAISGSGAHVLDLRHISIECELPRPFDPGISDEAKPTDIAISMFKDGELDLRIEAKTIVSKADLRKYVGADGMLRFEDGKNPYTVSPFGGMVAYVVDSDAETWSKEIAEKVASAVGEGRTYSRKIGTADHQVSKHSFALEAEEGSPAYSVDVVHLALEIDAIPSKRP